MVFNLSHKNIHSLIYNQFSIVYRTMKTWRTFQKEEKPSVPNLTKFLARQKPASEPQKTFSSNRITNLHAPSLTP